jgi:hypothetical protein
MVISFFQGLTRLDVGNLHPAGKDQNRPDLKYASLTKKAAGTFFLFSSIFVMVS